MIKTVKNKTTILLRLVFVLVIFVFSAKKAHAGWLDDAASSAIGSAVLYINNLIMYLLGNLLATVAELLGWFLKHQGDYFENISIVRESWAVFRDFSNMFFILILIVIAFATIFDMQQYNWKGLMAKFIFAALLINFSLAIGGFIIKISTTLSNVAINQFTDITGNLAAGAGINQFITAGAVAGSSADSLLKLTLSTFISGVGMIIMTAILLLAFLSALAFSIARVPVLWALLIVSPIAWITYILPQTRRIWSDWWKHFLCWTFFMPAYLFSLVMGIAILNNRPDIGAAATTTNFVGFGAQAIFFYVLTIIILVGSLGASLKMACAAGTGVAKTMGTISGGVNNWAKRTSYFSALQKGGKEKLAEIQKTGLPGKFGALYGGERAQKLKEARVAQGIFGERGAVQAEKDRAMREDIKTYKERFKATADVKELRNNMDKGPREQQLAIRELLKERGEATVEEMQGTFNLYEKSGSTSAAIEFAKNIDYEKLSSEERKNLYGTLGSKNAEIARKIAMAQAKKGDWRREEGESLRNKLKQYASLFATEGEKRDFLNEVKKFNFEDATKVMVDEKLIKDKTYTQAMEDEIKKLNIDKVAELSAGTLGKLFANPDARRLISDKITPDTVGNLAGKLSGEQLDVAVEKDPVSGDTTKTFKDLTDEKKKEFDAKKEETAAKAAEMQAEALAKALQKQTPPPASPQPRRTPGFVPPGSTVSGGEVKKPEENTANINPNNVLDLRKNN